MISSLFLFLYLITAAVTCVYCCLWLYGLHLGQKINLNLQTPAVSVIVAGHNEAHHIEALLNALLEQDYPEFEMIYVNDRSTDQSKTLLNTFETVRVIEIDNTPNGINPKKYALQRGMATAGHDLLLLTDADCLPRSNQWIKTMVAHNTSGIVLGVSFYKRYSGFLNYFIRYETVLTALQYCGFAGLGNPYMGVGRNLMYRKKLLKDEYQTRIAGITGGDDDLLVQQMARPENTTICIKSEGQTLSEPKQSLSEFLKQKTRHLSVGKYYSVKNMALLGLFQVSYLVNWFVLPFALVLSNELYLISVSFIIRTLCWLFTFLIAKKQFNIAFDLWGLLVLELLYIPYYLFTGITSLIKKQVKWN